MHRKNVVHEFCNLQVKIIDTSLGKVLPLVTEPPDKNIIGHIWMESAVLGKKTRGLLKIKQGTNN